MVSSFFVCSGWMSLNIMFARLLLGMSYLDSFDS